jgi:hypothetical protein
LVAAYLQASAQKDDMMPQEREWQGVHLLHPIIASGISTRARDGLTQNAQHFPANKNHICRQIGIHLPANDRIITKQL